MCDFACQRSHPIWVRGLKFQCIPNRVYTMMSHPIRARGLKSIPIIKSPLIYKGRTPHRVRGLKLLFIPCSYKHLKVAPYTGVWIEMFLNTLSCSIILVASYMGAWIVKRTSFLTFFLHMQQ